MAQRLEMCVQCFRVAFLRRRGHQILIVSRESETNNMRHPRPSSPTTCKPKPKHQRANIHTVREANRVHIFSQKNNDEQKQHPITIAVCRYEMPRDTQVWHKAQLPGYCL
jgi:hypothetical protein